MADWNKIKAEYITTNTSYRKLAEKYGVDQATVARRAKKEDWVSERKHHANKTQAKLMSADIKRKVTRAERLQNVADKLLDKIEAMMEACGDGMSPKEAKNISSTLKDLKEVQMVRSELDDEEQKARIAKLRREAEADQEDKNRQISIQIEGGEGSWAE